MSGFFIKILFLHFGNLIIPKKYQYKNMTKFFISIFLYLSLPFFGFSQSCLKIKAGMNFSKAVYLNSEGDALIKPFRQLKPGIVAGIALQQSVNKILSVQAEILYSQKGLKTTQAPYNTTINSMNYIEIPISGHYSLMKSKHSYFNLYIGGFGAYWLNGKYKREDWYTGEIISEKVDFHNPDYTYSRIDAGILAGAIYNIKNIDLFIRYTHSMTGSSELNTDALKNKVFSFGINYIILK